MSQNSARLILLLGLAAGSVTACLGQDVRPTATNPLHLTVELRSVSYCQPETFPSGIRGVHVAPTVQTLLSFQLHIQNVSQRNIIVCRRCIEGDGSRLFVTIPRGMMLISDYQADRFGFGPKVHYPSKPNRNYPVLKPGDFLNAEGTNLLVGTLDSTYPPHTGGISNGKYSFEASFDTFWERREVIESLAEQWKQYGELYSEGLVADPIPIDIRIPDNLAPCR